MGQRVRELRKTHRLTQEQLGERAGLSYKFIGEVERGAGNPTIETLASIASALGVELVDLVGTARTASHVGQITERDYAFVREARDVLEGMIQRIQGTKRSKSRRSAKKK